MVYSLCLRIIKSAHLAEEAAQDTFVKAYKKLSTFEERSSLKTWLYRIAYRTALDYARKKRKEVHLDDGMSVQSNAQSALSIIEEKELTQMVNKSVARLGVDECTVVTLYYLQEMSIKEIAEITNWTQSNIKIKLFRARHNLRSMLEGNRKKLQKS